MKKITILLLIISIFASAQNKYVFDNSTPRKTVQSHLNFLRPDNFQPKIAAYTLGGDLPPKQKQALSVKLKYIITKHKININDIPDKKGGFLGKKKFILFDDLPQIYLVRKNKKWIYSEETVNNINKIYNSYYIEKHKTKLADNKESKQQKDTPQPVKIELPDTQTVKFSLATPYNTVLSFFVFLSDSLYNPELASKTINFTGADTAKAIELTIKLKQVFLGADIKVFDIDEISKDTNYVDSVSGRHIYYPNPRLKELYLEKVRDKWLFSTVTSKLIESVHKEMYSNDAEDIFSFSDVFIGLAGNKSKKIFNLMALWQFYIIMFFLLIAFILLAVNKIIKTLVFRYLPQNRYKVQIAGVIKIISFIIFLYYVENYIPAIQLDITYTSFLHKLVKILIIYKYGVLSFLFVNAIKIYFSKEDKKKSIQGIVVFITLIIKTIIVITVIIFTIQTLEYSVVNILAGLSIGGFAIALGAQDTIKNFFGSILIFSDHPFQIGDYIRHNNISGTVEEVGLRTTKIRTPHDSIITIPNSKLSDSDIDNLGRRKYRRYKTYFYIDYNSPLEKIDELIESIEEYIKNNPKTRKDFYIISIDDFTDIGISMLLYVFFSVDNLKDEAKCKHNIVKHILNKSKELGIKFSVRLVHNNK